jgi:hypothetical protein
MKKDRTYPCPARQAHGCEKALHGQAFFLFLLSRAGAYEHPLYIISHNHLYVKQSEKNRLSSSAKETRSFASLKPSPFPKKASTRPAQGGLKPPNYC